MEHQTREAPRGPYQEIIQEAGAKNSLTEVEEALRSLKGAPYSRTLDHLTRRQILAAVPQADRIVTELQAVA